MLQVQPRAPPSFLGLAVGLFMRVSEMFSLALGPRVRVQARTQLFALKVLWKPCAQALAIPGGQRGLWASPVCSESWGQERLAR